jgi:hypothetical protein
MPWWISAEAPVLESAAATARSQKVSCGATPESAL